MLVANLAQKLINTQYELNTSPSEEEKDELNAKVTDLRDQHSKAVDELTTMTKEEEEQAAHRLEQLFIVKDMIEDFENILKKHDAGHASRVIISSMINNGVDKNVYHSGSIDGNHCMKFGERGSNIIDGIEKEMKKVISSRTNLGYLEALGKCFKEILVPLYSVMKVMKSVERQKQPSIKKFEQDVIALNKALNKLVEDRPVPGANVELPTFLKSHLMFDYHIQDDLVRWETLGGIDEQSMESTHPAWNTLMRRFGNSRGCHFNGLVMKQF